MAFKDTKHKGFVSNYTGNGIHSFGAFQYFQINDPSGTLDPYTGQVKVLDIATKAGLYSSTDTGSNITEVVYDPFSLQISAENATLSNVTVWSANSILTQGRGNSLYIADTTAVLVPVSYGNDLFYGHYQTKNRTGGFPYVSGGLLTGSNAMVGIVNQSDPCNIEFWPGDIFNQMRFRAYNKSIVINNDGFSVETGTANWTWSANSILTQGRGDARYQPVGSYLTTANAATTYLPSVNFTYANIGGTIPTATNTTLGAVKVGSGLSITNGTLSTTGGGSGVTAAKSIAYSMILGR